MTPFITEDFLLHNKAAKILYHDYAKDMPIYDYHCHLSPKEIAENKSFSNLAEIWLHGDHYKWRAMRSLGISEEFITGEKTDFEKFQAWSKTVPYTIGNPLFHWSHLELQRYFNTDILLNEETSEEIWIHCNKQLQAADFTTQKLIEKSNVKVVGTTDDPVDDLHYHKQLRGIPEFNTKVIPTFRPDQAVELTKSSFNDYIDTLSDVSEIPIKTYEDLLATLDSRAHYFHEVGCRISDHGLETFPFEECTFEDASKIFLQARLGETVTLQEEMKYKTHILLFLGRLYHTLGWAMQLHVGAIRDNSSRMHSLLGANTGFDSIHDFSLARQLNGFLNELDKSNELPKTIVYSLNPVHNYVIATACGNFQSEVKGKVQFGSGWWFNDQKDGMLRQMTDLSNLGLLSTFIGMLTDSRSFLSYTRHEYFRRLLCQLIGDWVEKGEAPEDYKHLGQIVQDICFNNAKEYFQVNID
ncbi:glucuronate isomerase [Anaerobacillus alkaliphilus]|uniref:Uronate isomerase n=1 Tax=Anaerobacillus alkaliphilus TaxID=1548597 RepID=A0A4Q0VUK4_9BACI|nr:glucuronate isomerase [Anaerobacillus alkaliphilus]RXJ02066.1 glucuronate isomerase [Anaerobacillus alkaliphilus]